MLQHKFTKTFRELTPKPRSVLILLLARKQDGEIAKEIGASEATVRKHIQNLCDHFEIPSEVAGIKKNRRQELITLATEHLSELVKDRTATPQSQQTIKIPLPANASNLANEEILKPSQDWGKAPDVSVFYGRTEQLNQLKTWILEDNCRLIALLGMAGIGKTSLSVKLAQQIQNEFDYVIWRSLRHAPSIERLLADLLQIFSRQSKLNLSGRVDDLISQLLEYLRTSRCLLILDNFDLVLESNAFVGHYREGYKGYGQLLKRLGQEPHKSCLILTSREKPREIALLEGETLPVRTLSLEGLDKELAKEILRSKGLSGEETWGKLIKLYRGNPLALMMVTPTIKELCNGNVTDFFSLSLTGIVKDIIVLIEQQFNRLSDLEKEIMYWLAIAQKPVSLTQLREFLLRTDLELFDALKSLGERDLIEKGLGQFYLQPAVMEYVRNQLVVQICQELDKFSQSQKLNDLKLLRSHALNQFEVQNNFEGKESESSSILTLFEKRLLVSRRSIHQNNLTEEISEILTKLKEYSSFEIGYAKTNLQNLRRKLQKN